MTEAVVHPLPSETTVVEEALDVKDTLERFYNRHHVVLAAVCVAVAALFINRTIMRRELRRMKFVIEVVGDTSFGDYGASSGLIDD